MSYPKRVNWKLVAAVLGMLAVGGPMLAFNIWLKRQGDDEVTLAAESALLTAETVLGQTVGVLRDLSARGVDTCRPPQIEAMRQATLQTGPIKELMLIGLNGQIMCTDTGPMAERHQVLSSVSTAFADVMLDVVALPDRGERFFRVRGIAKPGKPNIAAMVPASVLLPRSMMLGGALIGHARITMPDGTPVGESGAVPDFAAMEERLFQSRLRSNQFRFIVAVTMPRNAIIANTDDLRRIGMVASGVIALIILFFALLYPRRYADNPIAGIAKALLADEFVPYYQPIVDIQTSRLLGAEVLVRWRKSDGSFVEPNAFVPLIESSGLALELTRSLMRRVRKDLGEAAGKRPKLSIAFNVVPQHFDDALILNDIGAIFDGSPIKLSQIVLELTERHEVKDLAGMRRTIAALQGLGCKVAIDDVGTGHSGLSYILKLGVDIIKIDKIFVEAIGTEGHSKAIIETLIDLAKNLRMEVIAEGVETFDQVTYLRDRGIGAAQGYVFAPALPAGSFLKLLEAMDPVKDAAGAMRAKTSIVSVLKSKIARRAAAG